MMNEIKKNELNEQEIDEVTGGNLPYATNQNTYAEPEEALEFVKTVWEVIKHAVDVCG